MDDNQLSDSQIVTYRICYHRAAADEACRSLWGGGIGEVLSAEWGANKNFHFAVTLVMIAISSIDLYNLLRPKLGEQEAKALTEYISAVGESNAEKQTDVYEKIVNKDINVLRGEMRTEMAQMEGRLEAKIAETKAEIIKWMFIFWIGQIAVAVVIAKML